MDEWARENQITRLELTVETRNGIALKLYRKNGYVIEGKKIHAMRIHGRYVDEYVMAKVYK